jgi:hypothetical protein
MRRVRLADPRVVGANHLKAKITTGAAPLDVIAFNWADRAASLSGAAVDVAFRLERNTWKDQDVLQARVLTLTAAGS